MTNPDLVWGVVDSDFFRGFVEKISEGVIAVDDEGSVVFANSIAMNLLDVIPQDFVGAFFVKPEEMYTDFEISPVRRDGLRKVLQLCTIPIESNDRGLHLFLLRDVTNNAAIGSTLDDLRERYRIIVENAGEGIFTTTWTGRFITANPAFVRLLGYDSFDQMKQEINDLTSQFYPQPASQETYRKLLKQEGSVSNFEVYCFRRDGSQICGLFNSHVVRDDNGNILFVEGVFQDITGRKRVEEELRAGEARYMALYQEAKRGEELYQSLLKSSPDAVVVYDMQGRANFVSPSFSKMFGWSLGGSSGAKDSICS